MRRIMWIGIIQYDGGVSHWKNGSFFVLTSWLSIAWWGVLDCKWHHVSITQFVRLKDLYIKLELHVKYSSFGCNHQSSTCCCCFHHFLTTLHIQLSNPHGKRCCVLELKEPGVVAALFSTKAEYVALTHGVREALWLCTFLSAIGGHHSAKWPYTSIIKMQ